MISVRENILELLKNIHEAKELIEINDLLGLHTAEELKELENTLEELVSEYLVFKTKKDKYILLKNCPGLKIGKFSANKKGFGFVILEKEDDLYISIENVKDAIEGDVVLAEVLSKGFRSEGRIIRVLKRETSDFVGEIIETKKGLGVKLDDSKLSMEIKLDEESLKQCVPGHKVLIELGKQIANKRYHGRIYHIGSWLRRTQDLRAHWKPVQEVFCK